jgi:hypothetical protein
MPLAAGIVQDDATADAERPDVAVGRRDGHRARQDDGELLARRGMKGPVPAGRRREEHRGARLEIVAEAGGRRGGEKSRSSNATLIAPK